MGNKPWMDSQHHTIVARSKGTGHTSRCGSLCSAMVGGEPLVSPKGLGRKAVSHRGRGPRWQEAHSRVSLFCPQLGAMGDNVALLSGLAAFVEQLQFPFVLGGDWQMQPEDMCETQLPEFLGTSVCKAVAHTCRAKLGEDEFSLWSIGWFLVDDELVEGVDSTEVAREEPCRPHRPVVLTMKGELAQLC